ncbi:MAG: hypothetical protein AB7O97_04445 [Planctomycetota bacterium]
MRQGAEIRGPDVARPGTTIEIEVDTPGTVVLVQTGRPMEEVVVQDGRATIPVPADAQPGSELHVVLLGRLPPVGHTVTVVAK